MAGTFEESKGPGPGKGVCAQDITQGRRCVIHLPSPPFTPLIPDAHFVVIRLKQVEHVRNERNTLAAVAGHPFITTLVASFQDHDTLYMLVHLQTSHPHLS